jgi:uncharacterized protein (TIGR02266 family)
MILMKGQLERTPLLEVLQVIAYAQRSGVLKVEGHSIKGTIIFDTGRLICAHSTSTLPLLVKAAKERDSQRRAALQRAQSLATLTELFDVKKGSFMFMKSAAPVFELEGLDVRPFYLAGGMDTGDLLWVLAKSMDLGPPSAPAPRVNEQHVERRCHPRYGPIAVKAELTKAGSALEGYLTDLSLGGAFFHAEELPAVDSVYELRFTLPRELGLCSATARVAWIRAHVTDSRRGVGLSFEHISVDSQEKLSIFLDSFERLAAKMDVEG